MTGSFVPLGGWRADRLHAAQRLLHGSITETAARQVVARGPYRVTTRRKSLSRQNIRSITFRLRESAGLNQVFQRRFALRGIFGIAPSTLIAWRNQSTSKARFGDDQRPTGDDLNQRLAAAEVGSVDTEEVEPERLTALVARRVDLRGPSTTRAPDGVRAPPPFRPEARRYASASVASTETSADRPPAVASAPKMRRQTPLIAQRTESSDSVFPGPSPAARAASVNSTAAPGRYRRSRADSHLRLAAHILRQHRRKTPQMRLAQPKRIAHPGSPPHIKRIGSHRRQAASLTLYGCELRVRFDRIDRLRVQAFDGRDLEVFGYDPNHPQEKPDR